MKYLITLLVGLVVGGGAAIFLLGVPRAKALPGTPVQATSGQAAPSTVVMTLSDSFVNEMLATVFRDLGPPTFNLGTMTGAAQLTAPPANAPGLPADASTIGPPANAGGSDKTRELPAVDTDNAPRLPAYASGTENHPTFRAAAFQGGCTNSVTIASEGGGVKTHVQFANGNITAPLVFSGNYNLLGNCMQFKGWAQTSIQLSFDQPSQTLYGRANVEGVTLEGVNPLANNFVTVFVRNAIDSRVNPLEIIRPSQLQLMIPIKASNGSVKAQVKEVRSETQDGQLRLHITYEFIILKGDQPTG